jgi:hypothetical protein
MARLTLRTLLAYLDDTLEPQQARDLGRRVAENPEVQKLVERIKKVTRRRGLTVPEYTGEGDDVSDPNTVAEYLSDNLARPQVRELEETCLRSDVHLAEVAACHQILTLVLTEPVRVPPSAHQRMYTLVDPPASDPRRKPGKTIPVGGIAPTDPVLADHDEADAALLLGLKRYSASDTWAGRLGLVAAVGGVAVFLALAVLMALPQGAVEAPETSAGPLYAVALAPTPAVTDPAVGTTPGPKLPELKKDSAAMKKEPAEAKKEPSEAKKEPTDSVKGAEEPKKEPALKLSDPVQPPLPGEEVVGRLETESAIVLSRSPTAAGWTRLTPDNPRVRTNHPVVALPGYHADVKLDSEVTVHLWGNTPEQVRAQMPLLQSRVRFHPPAGGFDADLTLEAGRIYLLTRKPGGAKVRLRIATEVWDVALRGGAEVLVQTNTAFVPGTPYSRDDGERPRTDAQLVVLAGVADVHAPPRFRRFDGLTSWTEIAWDSKTGQIVGPQPTDKDRLLPDRLPVIEDDIGRSLQRTLSEAAAALTKPDGVRVVLKERLVAPPPTGFNPRTAAEALAVIFPVKWAAYSQAAIMDGPEAADLLKDMIDLLADRLRAYAREGAVTALSSWIAQAPGNTALLVKGMLGKGWLEEDADLVARLLRGYSAPTTGPAAGDGAKLDELVSLLNHPQIAVREAARGNLLGFYGSPELEKNPILYRTDVALRAIRRGKDDPETAETRRWESFLTAWENYARDMKERMKAGKKP